MLICLWCLLFEEKCLFPVNTTDYSEVAESALQRDSLHKMVDEVFLLAHDRASNTSSGTSSDRDSQLDELDQLVRVDTDIMSSLLQVSQCAVSGSVRSSG